MNQLLKEQIADALYKKSIEPCPRCKSLNFDIIGQTMLAINDDIKVLKIGGPSIPCAIVTCSNCGFITLHSIGILNLMNQSISESNE